jgi:mitochondrial Rho GTPase 1
MERYVFDGSGFGRMHICIFLVFLTNLYSFVSFFRYFTQVPVIVAENKLDLFRPSSSISRSSAAHLSASSSSLSNTSSTAATQQVIGPTDEQALARKRQQIVALMQRFTFVRQCIKCSAKNLLRVDDVFLKAQQAVWYPFVPPLYDLQTGQLTVACQRALTRIFRIFDRDHDGLLSDIELDRFQRETYHFAIVDRDLAAWKKVVTRNNPHPDIATLQEGKFTIQGFWTIFDVFISQNRLDVVWQALRKYQYDDDLQLHVPDSMFQEGASWQLTRAAQQFLTRVFHQFADADSGLLSPDQIRTIWSILPPPALPPWIRTTEWSDGCFSVLKEGRGEHWLPPSREDVSPPSPDVEQSILTTSGISILSESLPSVEGMDPLAPLSYLEWMGHWHTLAAMAPSVARAELYRLGHISEPRRERSSKGSSASRAIRVAVLGARNAGKTALLSALCGSNGDEITPTSQPETSWTYVQLPRRLEDREGEALVVHLIFTDIPESALPGSDGRSLSDLMGTSTSKEPFCDLSMLVFDCTDAQSWTLAKEMEAQLLTKDIPRLFVATKEDRLATADASVLDEAQQYCHASDLEPPLVTASASLNRSAILDHLARCAIEDEPGIDPLKSKPHEAEHRAARRRKRLWLGGIVVVVVGVGWLWSRAQRDRPGNWRWLRSWWGRPNKVSS